MSYRLKVILDTSIPLDKKQEVILTSSLLEYNPKRKLPLEEYPLFSPHVTYSRDLILNMPYHKRVELFFNTQKFKKNIMALWNGVIENDKKEQTKRENNNVDVFISAILPTAYPVANNYDRSYDFFQPRNDGNVFSSIMSSFSKSEFSHLKINQKMYTVVGVILKNDVFNHPVYSSFLQEFANVEQHAQDDPEDEFIEFYKNNIEKNKDLWVRFSKLVTVRTTTTATNPSLHKDDYPVNQMHDILVQINTEVGKVTDIPTPEQTKVFEDLFNYLSEHNSIISNLDKIKASYSDIKELKLVVKEFSKIWIKKKALEYIKNKKFDFSSEGSKEKEIRDYIEKINPSFRNFSDMIKILQKDRMIENKGMRDLIKKMETTKLKELLDCRNDQAKCASLAEGDAEDENLIQVGLDRVKSKESSFTTIEICLMVNVIEGNINSENIKKIKCSYLNKSLGSLFESFLHPLKTWDITNRKMFFSIQDDLAKMEKKETPDKKKGKTLNKKGDIPQKTKTRRLK